jgi:hypothetical protein
MGNYLKTWKDKHCLNMGLICINTYNTLPVMHIACCMFTSRINMYAMYYTGTDPGFQAGRGALKEICTERREGRKLLRYFVWKITILRQFFFIFSNFRGRFPPPPPGSAPIIYVWSVYIIDDCFYSIRVMLSYLCLTPLSTLFHICSFVAVSVLVENTGKIQEYTGKTGIHETNFIL